MSVADEARYEIYYELFLGGRFAQQIDDLHQRYGELRPHRASSESIDLRLCPIVRINPFEVHINDPTFYDTLYNFDRRLEKRTYHIRMSLGNLSWSWNITKATTNSRSIDNVQHTGPYHQHNHRRRALTHFLTPGAIQQIEPLICLNIAEFCRRLCEARSSQQPASFSHLYRCMTADIITTFTLGESYELLQNPKESESFLRAFAFSFRLLWLLREIPYLSIAVRWAGKTLGRWLRGDWVLATLLRWQWVSAEKLLLQIPLKTTTGYRCSDKQSSKQGNPRKGSVFNHLLIPEQYFATPTEDRSTSPRHREYALGCRL